MFEGEELSGRCNIINRIVFNDGILWALRVPYDEIRSPVDIEEARLKRILTGELLAFDPVDCLIYRAIAKELYFVSALDAFPFPLMHTDLGRFNNLVDDNFNIAGYITHCFPSQYHAADCFLESWTGMTGLAVCLCNVPQCARQ
jgi:hypothetical protein